MHDKKLNHRLRSEVTDGKYAILCSLDAKSTLA